MDCEQIIDRYRKMERRLVDAVKSGRIEVHKKVLDRVGKYNFIHNAIRKYNGSIEKTEDAYKERLEIANHRTSYEFSKFMGELDMFTTE